MSSREVITINTDADRQKAARWAGGVSFGTVIEFRRKSRSTEQNAKLWAMLSEVSEQVEWYGQKLDAEDWKDMFTASLRHARVVPGIDKGTYVPLGMRTSNMTIDEMGNLIELVYAFGAQHEPPVVFKDPKPDTESGAVSPDAPADDERAPSGSSFQEDAAELTQPSPTAADSSPIPQKELPYLRSFAKDVLTTANSGPTPEAMKKVMNRWWNGELTNVSSKSGIDAIKAIRLSVDAIMLNDGSVNFDHVIELHAEGLDCDPSELGGRS